MANLTGYLQDKNGNRLFTDENYSTKEQIIGTWVDNKPLYKRTYIINIPDATTTGYCPTELSNIDVIYIDSGNSYLVFIPNSIVQVGFYNSATDYTRAYITWDKSKIGYRFGEAYNPGDKVLVITIKYTKTTD